MHVKLMAIVVVVGTAAFTTCARAADQKDRVAIGVLNLVGAPVSDELRAKYLRSLRGGLEAGFEVEPDANVAAAVKRAAVAGCDTVQCMQRIGELVNVPYVVRVTLQTLALPGASKISVELIDVTSGRVAAEGYDPCDSCSLKEANESVSNLAAELRTKLDKQRLTVTTEKPKKLMPRRHERMTPTQRWTFRGLGIGFVGAGLGLVVEGIVEAQHNNDPVDAAGHTKCSPCEYHLDTTTPRNGFLGAGIAVAVVGLGFSVAGWIPLKPRIEMVPEVSSNSFRLSLAGRF